MALNNETKVGIYNLDIPLPERKDKVKVYKTIRLLSQVSGITENRIRYAIETKKSIRIDRLNGTFAIRHIK
jgi:hypothetical protein